MLLRQAKLQIHANFTLHLSSPLFRFVVKTNIRGRCIIFGQPTLISQIFAHYLFFCKIVKKAAGLRPGDLVFYLTVLFSEQLALLLFPVEWDAFAQP